MTAASSPDAAVEKVAAVLEAHEGLDMLVVGDHWAAACQCGESKPVDSSAEALDWHRAHVAAALLASGALTPPAEAETAVAVDGSLTEDERDALMDACPVTIASYVGDHDELFALVERIVAQRTAAAKAEAVRDALEAAADAIEAAMPPPEPTLPIVTGERSGHYVAAAIVRDRADRFAAEESPDE